MTTLADIIPIHATVAPRTRAKQKKPPEVYERNGRFVKGGKAGPGRPKGLQDRFTREIKQAMLDAAELVGEEKIAEQLSSIQESDRKKVLADPNTPRGITAYLAWIHRDYPQVACAMLARMMPEQKSIEHRVQHTYRTMEEIAGRLRELGLTPQRIYPLIESKPVIDQPSDAGDVTVT